jgi:hypothetical protein
LNLKIFICSDLCLLHVSGRLRSVSSSPLFYNRYP